MQRAGDRLAEPMTHAEYTRRLAGTRGGSAGGRPVGRHGGVAGVIAVEARATDTAKLGRHVHPRGRRVIGTRIDGGTAQWLAHVRTGRTGSSRRSSATAAIPQRDGTRGAHRALEHFAFG